VGRLIGIIVAAILVLLIVATVALWRPDIPYARLEAKYAAPSSKFVDLAGGVRLHYREDGDRAKPAVILVHGYGDSFATWDRWIADLSPDFRVLALDLPGHGLTQAPQDYAPSAGGYADVVVAFADRLGLSRYALAGNSMGGGVAWLVALRRPDRVGALVLMDASGWPPAATPPPPPLAFQLLGSPAGVIFL
jgi:pimeloyl-ACP methyl ester carboxylesterase